MNTATPMLLVALLVACATLALCEDPTKYKDFLLRNVMKASKMPLSYDLTPSNYFTSIPESERPDHYTHPEDVYECGGNVSASNMNKYMFQTEQLLTALGLNIYDGAVWCIALSLIGEGQTCLNYLNNVLVKDKTVQFADIRGDAPCKGTLYNGQCKDPTQGGACGFCYGLSDATLTSNNAFFFRMISDYWAIEGTVDQRCPEKNHLWTWNDYKPILGENTWATLLGPIHSALLRYNYNVDNIPASDPAYALGIPFITALEQMMVGKTGAFFFCPRNTWFGFNKVSQNIGNTFSIENQGSLLASLTAFYKLIDLSSASTYKSYLPQIKGYIEGLQRILLEAYDPSLGYFRQGGTYDASSGTINWGQNGEPLFAVDCQTWVSSVLGSEIIDNKYGQGTSYNLWQTVKKFANYSCTDGTFCGVGYTMNNYSGQVLSGEWTYGAMNWLRILMNESTTNAEEKQQLLYDVMNMSYGIESDLWVETTVQNSTNSYDAILYANERYWIPFGWYANPLPATSSTGWAVMVASNFNPFNIFGTYSKAWSW